MTKLVPTEIAQQEAQLYAECVERLLAVIESLPLMGWVLDSLGEEGRLFKGVFNDEVYSLVINLGKVKVSGPDKDICEHLELEVLTERPWLDLERMYLIYGQFAEQYGGFWEDN